MALNARALVTTNELRRAARSKDFTNATVDRFVDAINEASAIIRRHTGRRLLFKGTDYVEFHDILHGEVRLWLRERPIISITKVEEDSDRTYGVATELTEGTDYLLDKNRGILSRISGTTFVRWEPGLRPVKVTYQGGYDDSTGDKANVPSDLKYVCLNVALRILRENDRAMQGISSKSGPEGSTTRFDATKLAEHEVELLSNFVVRGPQTYITDEAVA